MLHRIPSPRVAHRVWAETVAHRVWAETFQGFGKVCRLLSEGRPKHCWIRVQCEYENLYHRGMHASIPGFESTYWRSLLLGRLPTDRSRCDLVTVGASSPSFRCRVCMVPSSDVWCLPV